MQTTKTSSDRQATELRAGTAVVGRQKELEELETLLAQPTCRLLTLVGPGGIGKTTLALHVASQASKHFSQGMCFIPLQPVQSAELIAGTLAEELGVTLSGVDEPLSQVCRYLVERELLLIFDNYEHILDGVDVLPAILRATSAVKIIVTSREALNLHDEWLYPVHGLTYPKEGTSQGKDAGQKYGAVELFDERARRVRPTFAVAAEEDCVVRICRLVDGIPLALELAATWAKTMRCAEIADQIETNLEFLTSRLRDLPRRHQSMRAVFDATWSLLSDAERAHFMRLSVFRGGFTAEAASAVCGASLATLMSLVDKSLLRWDADGRYRVHELLRQYAESELENSPREAERVRESHCHYFTEFLYERREGVVSEHQGVAITEIEEEIDNVRAAWQWGIESRQATVLQKMIQTLPYYYQFRSRYREGTAAYLRAIRAFDNGATTQAEKTALVLLFVYSGWLYIRLGELDEGERALQRSRALYDELELPPLPGCGGTDPEIALGLIRSMQGNFEDAVQLGEKALKRNVAAGHRKNLPFVYYVLASATLKQGKYSTARKHAQAALATTQEIGDRWFMAICLAELGQVEEALGNDTVAEQHFRASYTLCKELNDPGGMAVALNHLGQIALSQQKYTPAKELFDQSHEIYAKVNDQGGLAVALVGLGAVATAGGHYSRAQQHFHQALQLAVEMQNVPIIFSIFLQIGNLFLHTENAKRGLELLTTTRDHPASIHTLRERAKVLLAQHRGAALPEKVTAFTIGQSTEPVETMAAALLLELLHTTNFPDSNAVPVGASPPVPQDLVEPLTPRELEILELLNRGLTNQQIADELVIALGTVKAHNHTIFGKLGVNNRTSAIASARRLGLL